VKVDKELRTMINSLVSVSVDNPSLGAILIQGSAITTFKMDVVAPNCYRLTALTAMTTFDSLSDIYILLTIVSRLQIKEISLETARKVQVLDSECAAHMMSLSVTPNYMAL
jgi:hypothetical protein